ncbi:MAG: hypothetical protein JWN86_266 [Planctomycetota bacterium]|nr:hypothetical protein [Planctomycetota bacterium]
MKTITKLSALGVVVLGLAGCAEDNEKNLKTDSTTGKLTGPGAAPAGAIKDSKAFMEGQKGKQPMNAAGAQSQGK